MQSTQVFSRTTKTVFSQHALVVTYFKLSQAYESHERALSWETSSRAWLANVRAIEMENGLIPVPASSGFLIVGALVTWASYTQGQLLS